ncbi:coiled-coil domain-containing protein 180-like isoform X6 [Sebastes fasciatus]|uniref:coiled-coil domain-containing protein 180-like isoform X6 n=1 Tax=Sebastes fasciatus TaxID=394691 RepID=UPI003D9DCA58
MEDDVLTADSSQRLEAVSSTLQDCLDQHIKDTQRCQTSFRKTVHTRLEEVRTRTAHLLLSFRLFSEGGDFAPQEVKEFQRRLKEETRQISVTEHSVFSELEVFESRSLQQVKEAAARLEEKLSFLKSEVEFNEKIQKIISSTRVQIKAEAASSNQQQSSISSRLEDLRRTMEDTQALTVSPDQVCSFLSSVNEELRKRCQYLDFSLESLSAGPKSRKPVRSAPPLGLLQTSRTGVDLLDDPAVCIIKSLNRFCVIRDVGAEASERDERGRTAAGQNPVQRLQQKCSESVSTLSVRRGCRSIRTEMRFQVFGPEPEQKPHSFSSTLTSLFWRTNDVLLLVAEVFYQSERCGLSGFFLVPDSLDQWAESMQQRLLGYQEETRKLLSTSRAEMVRQLSVCLSLPVCLSESETAVCLSVSTCLSLRDGETAVCLSLPVCLSEMVRQLSVCLSLPVCLSEMVRRLSVCLYLSVSEMVRQLSVCLSLPVCLFLPVCLSEMVRQLSVCLYLSVSRRW